MRPPLAVLLLASLAFAGCASDPVAEEAPPAAVVPDGRGDAVVIAVVDSGFNPYHFDFRAGMMPQHRNADPSDDLPLSEDPATWLPGFPAPASFASYGALDLTFSDDPDAESADLHEADAKAWGGMRQSSADEVHFRYVPGTKAIGFVTFNSGDGFAPGSHGVGSASVSVGNLHGTCPHCLLVFVDGTREEANRWVEQQDWIDAQTNSWGISSNPVGLPRDRVYAGSDTESQRTAVERGQQIFFSAGNGLMNDFSAPNPTLFSSQEGPDWIVTVGAISPDGDSYTGHGKPAEVAAPGSAYTSAYGSSTLNGTGSFGGTSNATPVTAGLYGEALYRLRRMMEGVSRVQQDGTISVGAAACGEADPACALADGALTVHELRTALFRSANYTSEGWDAAGVTGPIPGTNNARETVFLAEGHGSFWGRMQGDAAYEADVRRIAGFAAGAWTAEQDAEQLAWFTADAVCRQGGWGTWGFGYAPNGEGTVAPSPAWPVRTWMATACPATLGAAVAAERAVGGVL